MTGQRGTWQTREGASVIRGGRGRDQGRARLGILASCLLLSAFPVLPSASAPAATPAAADAPHRGLTAGGVVAAAYDTVLDADFDAVPALLSRTCGPAPDVACLGLRALATWWEIQLDPQSRFLDARFLREANAAIEAAAAWTTGEPQRAETWFYLGAALGVRGQWRVLRNERPTPPPDLPEAYRHLA